MLKLLGMVDIKARTNDRSHYLEPPYDSPLQQHALEQLKRQLLDEERYQTIAALQKKQFLAAGGDPDDYQRYRTTVDRQMTIFREQIEAGEYYTCSSGGFLYAVRARKPSE
ncbi:MAG: hypothetical protein KKG33_01630 [candidate division Zixibacteria bacterium]|nr:hypothetical protein [candidate division Zixibacteria bacterium]MBU1469485.1 hypothetical protein [candidate division Zixibacteria bacterium]MBU2624239.1 hypothetical protein [candidate division Zixibacteria bacterium]